jgi:hypothetical protein
MAEPTKKEIKYAQAIKELATMVGHDIDTIRVTFEAFKDEEKTGTWSLSNKGARTYTLNLADLLKDIEMQFGSQYSDIVMTGTIKTTTGVLADLEMHTTNRASVDVYHSTIIGRFGGTDGYEYIFESHPIETTIANVNLLHKISKRLTIYYTLKTSSPTAATQLKPGQHSPQAWYDLENMVLTEYVEPIQQTADEQKTELLARYHQQFDAVLAEKFKHDPPTMQNLLPVLKDIVVNDTYIHKTAVNGGSDYVNHTLSVPREKKKKVVQRFFDIMYETSEENYSNAGSIVKVIVGILQEQREEEKVKS